MANVKDQTKELPSRNVQIEEVAPLAASTSLIANMTTIYGMTPNAASQARANNPNGPILDISGSNGLALNHLKDSASLLNYVKTDTDATDPSLTQINAVLAALNGTTGPSAGVITSMNVVIAAGPTSATVERTNSPSGPIMDYIANTNVVNLMFKETRNVLKLVQTVLDAGDPMFPLVTDVLATLV